MHQEFAEEIEMRFLMAILCGEAGAILFECETGLKRKWMLRVRQWIGVPEKCYIIYGMSRMS